MPPPRGGISPSMHTSGAFAVTLSFDASSRLLAFSRSSASPASAPVSSWCFPHFFFFPFFPSFFFSMKILKILMVWPTYGVRALDQPNNIFTCRPEEKLQGPCLCTKEQVQPVRNTAATKGGVDANCSRRRTCGNSNSRRR